MQMINSYGYSNQNNPNSKNKKMLNLVIIGIVIVLLISAVLIGAIYYLNIMQQKALKVYVDDKKIDISENAFIIKNDKVYVSIKDIAKYLGYEVHNGEYKINSEEPTKCYVENENETASFFLNSNKVCKVAPNSKEDYKEFIITEPVKSENNKLYVISDGIQIGCNIKFNYDSNTNTIKIYTLPNLVNSYNALMIKYGYKGLSTNFDNQKAILYNMYVVQNSREQYGVVNDKNDEIIGCKYEDIRFDENAKEFFVTNTLSKVGIILANGSNKVNIEYDEINTINKDLYIVKNNGKYGIIDKNGSTKVNVAYEDIKSLDSDLGLYIVKYNGKYGVINETDKQIIYWEYDTIGLDTKSYTADNIENPYLLFENLIPVKRNNKWGLCDITGKEVLPCEYDGFGCIPTGIKDKVVNSTLIIPDCEAIVVKNDKKYGIINKNGDVLVQYLLNAVYSTTSTGENTYYMNFDHDGETIEYEVLWYLEQMGLYKPKKEENKNNELIDIKENKIENNTVVSENVVENNIVE